MEKLELTEAKVKTRLKQHYIDLGMTEADATRKAGIDEATDITEDISDKL
jgi:hypothetical protein